jgi:ADP-ribose pyrophosphatase YjhB (NUDIX family)
MKFCAQCGCLVTLRVPPDDDRLRHVCDECGSVFYNNPKIVAGCIPEWEGKLLICRRAIEPRYGLWTLPAGFMELEETTAEAAARETLEEANARVVIDGLFGLFNIPHINQVYLIYRAQLIDGLCGAGRESLEVRLVEEEAVPWTELAFPVMGQVLRLYFDDRRNGAFQFHTQDIRRALPESRD